MNKLPQGGGLLFAGDRKLVSIFAFTVLAVVLSWLFSPFPSWLGFWGEFQIIFWATCTAILFSVDFTFGLCEQQQSMSGEMKTIGIGISSESRTYDEIIALSYSFFKLEGGIFWSWLPVLCSPQPWSPEQILHKSLCCAEPCLAWAGCWPGALPSLVPCTHPDDILQ